MSYEDDLQILDRQIHGAQNDVERGRRAKELLEEPLIAEAFDILEAQWTQAWKGSRRDEPEKREEAYRALAAVLDLKGYFGLVVEKGRDAKPMLESFAREREGILSRMARILRAI